MSFMKKRRPITDLRGIPEGTTCLGHCESKRLINNMQFGVMDVGLRDGILELKMWSSFTSKSCV